MTPLRFAGETFVYVICEHLGYGIGLVPDPVLLLLALRIFISAFGVEPLAYIKWPLAFLIVQTLRDIDICRIYQRFACTKSMVDLVNLPNARYNQCL